MPVARVRASTSVTDLPAESPRGPLERRHPGELSPAERALRRRNRRLLLMISVPAVIVGAAALIAAVVASSSAPSVKPSQVPAGYKAVTDGYFGYAVPSNWSTNDLFTDAVGDLETSGGSGWVAEHVGVRSTPPVPGEAAPSSLRSLGTVASGGGQSIAVPGAQTAYRYGFSPTNGPAGVAVDAWQASTGAELWLVIEAPPGITSEILASLKA